MVVLAAAVCSRSGKTLISRQFVDITKSRIEALLASFPNLIETEKQHTFIETSSVRYIYQPIESLYVVIITNKASNILEDLEALHLLVKIVPEICRSLDEEEIIQNCFELIYAFDECINVKGRKEKVNLSQIQSFTEMDSQEEKIFEMIERNKKREAIELAKRKQYEIEHARSEQYQNNYYNDQQYQDNNGSSGSSGDSSFSQSQDSYIQQQQQYEQQQQQFQQQQQKILQQQQQQRQQQKSRGMVIAPKKDTFEKIMRQDGIQLNTSQSSSSSSASSASTTTTTTTTTTATTTTSSNTTNNNNTQQKSVHVKMDEYLSIQHSRNDGLQSMKIRGDLNLFIRNPDFAHIALKTDQSNCKQLGFSFQTHPNINRPLFQKESVLALRDSKRAFPTNNSVGLVKWRMSTNDEDRLPIEVVCWPEELNNSSIVSLSYTLSDESLQLLDLVITINAPTNPIVQEISDGETAYNNNGTFSWHVPLVEQETSSSSNCELKFPKIYDSETFFPVKVSFTSKQTISPFKLLAIGSSNGKKVDWSIEKKLHVEQFLIQ